MAERRYTLSENVLSRDGNDLVVMHYLTSDPAIKQELCDALNETTRLQAELEYANRRIEAEAGDNVKLRKIHVEETTRLQARVELLEEAITNASLLICHHGSHECMAAMRVFGEVMDAAAMKRMGI